MWRKRGNFLERAPVWVCVETHAHVCEAAGWESGNRVTSQASHVEPVEKAAASLPFHPLLSPWVSLANRCAEGWHTPFLFLPCEQNNPSKRLSIEKCFPISSLVFGLSLRNEPHVSRYMPKIPIAQFPVLLLDVESLKARQAPQQRETLPPPHLPYKWLSRGKPSFHGTHRSQKLLLQ